MYDDFKNRVVQGRGIHPEVIDLIAGGRVMTGLTAFGLTAPADLIREIKGLDLETSIPTVSVSEVLAEPEAVPSLSQESSTPVTSTPSPTTASEDIIAVAIISEDQETSPFAPPTSISNLPIEENNSVLPSNPTTSISVAKETGSVLGSVAGSYEVVAGPFGRGLVDGLGGIRDAAVYATELFVSFLSVLLSLISLPLLIILFLSIVG